MQCKKCGNELQSNEKFCTVCGYFNEAEEDDDFSFDDDFSDNLDDIDDIALNSSLKGNLETDDDKTLDDILNDTKSKTEENNSDEFSSKYLAISENDDSSNEKYDSLDNNQDSLEDDKSNLSREDIFLKAYIGEDYQIIKKSYVNIFAALLNWIYLLYRKMYIIGIIGLITAGFFIVKLPKIFPIYVVIIMIILGLTFNKLYISIAKIKINRIEKKYEGSDDSILEEIMEEKGGVNFVSAIMIYFIFIIAVVICLFPLRFNKNNNTKFWKENSENRANCISLIKKVNKELQKDGTVHTISEASCKLLKNTTTDYELYLKDISNINPNYYYYLISDGYITKNQDTTNITVLEEKEINNNITQEEKNILLEKKKIKNNYQIIYNAAKKEDRLIKQKKNTSEKKNYVFSQEEVER